MFIKCPGIVLLSLVKTYLLLSMYNLHTQIVFIETDKNESYEILLLK